MYNDADNPYAPPNAEAQGKSHPFFGVRSIFFVHLVAIFASFFIVSSEAILSSQILQTFIALPIFCTTIVCPIAMLIAAIASPQQRVLVRGLAVCGDLVMSAIQFMIWLPTVQ